MSIQVVDTPKRTEKEYVRISKAMTYILRHGIVERSLKMDDEGYIDIDSLMNQPEMKNVTIDDVTRIVDNSDKKRFTIREEGSSIYIRANQGHSKDIGDKINDESLLKKIDTPIQVCVHGTDRNSWKKIQKSGLSPMKRKHIHLASGLYSDEGVISGMRKNSKVVIHIDMEKAMNAGKTFYISTNGVILTSDILEPEFFSKVQFN